VTQLVIHGGSVHAGLLCRRNRCLGPAWEVAVEAPSQ
jgi:hypothetical protein